MVRSFAALERVSPGFAPNHLLTLQLSLAPARYDTRQKIAAFYDALQAKLEAVPSVESVGSAVSLPPDLLSMTDNFIRPAPIDSTSASAISVGSPGTGDIDPFGRRRNR
jgi:hypothetical protein